MEESKFRSSKTNCCVVGCHSAYYNTNKSIKFYNFPRRWYEVERRNVWIKSVRRINGETGKEWQPKLHDKICSLHFIGNAKSNHPNSPSFHPTVFPKEYKKHGNLSNMTADSRGKRFERLQNRRTLKVENNAPSSTRHFTNVDTLCENIETKVDTSYQKDKLKTQEFSCQVDMESFGIANSFVFESNINYVTPSSCDVETQVTISEKKVVFCYKTQDKCVGIEEVIECKGFHGYKSVKDSPESLKSLAGLTVDRFLLLLSFLSNVHGNSKLSSENRLLLFLMKMKLGISNTALGVLFNMHKSSVSRTFLTILNELVQKTINIVFWPTRNVIDNTMPKAFKRNYPKCRVIIDCTEVVIQQPKKVDQRIYTYSQYKSNFTAKFLVGIAPSGFVSFVSKCYGGRSSDTFITNDCGILQLLEANDLVLADKGFPGIKCKEDVVLVLPPFVHDGKLSLEEIEETYSIASVRIHVERSIQRIKTYNILLKVPHNLFSYLDDIVYMCCVLTNLQPPTIKEDHEDDD